ncbi:MAG TPA: DnaJ domain-containing protein [Thermodesulfovibrionales bacterium]|nr:DnaJ domain-containing protein [Thermodesulfovibrionales bacterium]
MDRFSDNDSGKKLIYQGALELIGEVGAGISWERFSIHAVLYADAYIDMLNGTEEARHFLSTKGISPEYVNKHVRDILARLHFNRGNDHYLTLCLPRGASDAQIHKRWKDLMLIYHPDRSRDPGDAGSAKRINEAYNVLKHQDKKREYDMKMTTTVDAHFRSHRKKVHSPERSHRRLFISPNMRRLLPKLIIPCSILISSIILLMIFLNNRPAPSISQAVVHHKEGRLNKGSARSAAIPEQDKPQVEVIVTATATATAPAPEMRKFYSEESGPLLRDERAQKRPSVTTVITQPVNPSVLRKPADSADRVNIPAAAPFEKNPAPKMEFASAGSTAPSKAPDRISEKGVIDSQLQKKPEPVRDIGAPGQAPKTLPGGPLLEAKLSDLEAEVFLFLVQYIHAYEEGDISKFMGFFSRGVVENGTSRYDDIKRSYKKNFENNRYSYTLKNVDINKKEAEIIVTGDYIIKTAASEDKGPTTSGKMRWTLGREDGNLRIVRMDYGKR